MHPLYEEHDPGFGHPERPARYASVEAAVRACGAPVTAAPAAPRAALERVHAAEYLLALEDFALRGGGALDADTIVGPESFAAASHAAGAAVAAVDAILGGELNAAFCAGRPPGHHAEPQRAMGFCLINSAAVAAAHARARGVERVAVLDWDAHHGNGTQRSFYADPSVLYVSLHQWPFYPWTTGAGEERGEGEGEGANLNIPLPAGVGERRYLEAFTGAALPALEAFDPGLVVVSAGFDGHRDDPLCDLGLSPDAFARMTSALDGLGAGRVFVLEGGYDLAGLEASVGAVLSAVAA